MAYATAIACLALVAIPVIITYLVISPNHSIYWVIGSIAVAFVYSGATILGYWNFSDYPKFTQWLRGSWLDLLAMYLAALIAVASAVMFTQGIIEVFNLVEPVPNPDGGIQEAQQGYSGQNEENGDQPLWLLGAFLFMGAIFQVIAFWWYLRIKRVVNETARVAIVATKLVAYALMGMQLRSPGSKVNQKGPEGTKLRKGIVKTCGRKLGAKLDASEMEFLATCSISAIGRSRTAPAWQQSHFARIIKRAFRRGIRAAVDLKIASQASRASTPAIFHGFDPNSDSTKAIIFNQIVFAVAEHMGSILKDNPLLDNKALPQQSAAGACLFAQLVAEAIVDSELGATIAARFEY